MQPWKPVGEYQKARLGFGFSPVLDPHLGISNRLKSAYGNHYIVGLSPTQRPYLRNHTRHLGEQGFTFKQMPVLPSLQLPATTTAILNGSRDQVSNLDEFYITATFD